jgi:hypothetical protein
MQKKLHSKWNKTIIVWYFSFEDTKMKEVSKSVYTVAKIF